jgi:hypothetical protein
MTAILEPAPGVAEAEAVKTDADAVAMLSKLTKDDNSVIF